MVRLNRDAIILSRDLPSFFIAPTFITSALAFEEVDVGLTKLIGKGDPEAPHVAAAVGILVEILCIVNGTPAPGVEHIVDAESKGALITLQEILTQGRIYAQLVLALALG